MPASTGPRIRDTFIEMPFSARAAGKSGRGTISGMMAANTGQRSAKPIPCRKVSASNQLASRTPVREATASIIPTMTTQSWVAANQRRRSRISANAPLGTPSRNTGKVDAACTSATRKGEVVRLVINQPAATSLAHMTVFATIQTSQRRRKTGPASGSNASDQLASPGFAFAINMRNNRQIPSSNVNISCN